MPTDPSEYRFDVYGEHVQADQAASAQHTTGRTMQAWSGTRQ